MKILNLFRQLVVAIAIMAAVALPLVVTAQAAALDPFQAACSSPGSNASQSAACSTSAGSGTVDPVSSVLNKVTYLMSIILGVIAVIFIIVGGFNYVTASGDPSSVASAKKTIIYAIVGLLVAALARPIINLVVGKAT